MLVKLKCLLKEFATDESGATAIEYGLIAALVSVAIIGILGSLGDELTLTFTEVRDGLQGAAEEAAEAAEE